MHSTSYRFLTAIALTILTLALVPDSCAAVATLRPVRLLCERQDNPLAVDESRPGLGWILRANSPTYRGLRQTAYRILVAKTRRSLHQDDGYELRLNGRRVGNREMDPGWTKAKGVVFRSMQDQGPHSITIPRVVFEVGSGRYRFVSTLPVRSVRQD